MRHAGQPECQRISQDLRVENGADERCEVAKQHPEQHGRHRYICDDDAHESHSCPDDEDQTQEDCRDRSQNREETEFRGPLFHPEHMERKERESDRKCVQQNELQRSGRAHVSKHRASEPVGSQHDRDEQRAVHAEQEEENGAREALSCATVLTLVEEPHERSVETPPEQDLGHDFDRAEQPEDPVVPLAQVADVDRQQQQIDSGHRHVAGAVDRKLLPEFFDFLWQGLSVSGT